MELRIRPNPVPQEDGVHRYRLLLTAGGPLWIVGVTGRLVAADGQEVYRQEWDPREVFGAQEVPAGETVLAPRLTLGRFTGTTAHWTVRAVTAGGAVQEVTATAALTLPPDTERVIYRRNPDREAVMAWPARLGSVRRDCGTPGGNSSSEQTRGAGAPAKGTAAAPGPAAGATPAVPPQVPALILVHGSESSAATLAWIGRWAAHRGYVAVALSQPGFGGSAGPPDFAGPRTVAALRDGFDWVRSLPGVDPHRIGLWGVSRGAIAAANLATQCSLPGLRALVLQAGAYDLLQPEVAPLRDRLLPELGSEPAEGALRQRSSLLRAGGIPCPVLILHGGRDTVIPDRQSERLAQRLRELGKPHEYRHYPDRGHFLPARRVWEEAIFPFLERHVGPGGSEDVPAGPGPA